MYYTSGRLGSLAALEEGVALSSLGRLRIPKVAKPPKPKKTRSRYTEPIPGSVITCGPGTVLAPDGVTCATAGGPAWMYGVSKTWLQQVMSHQAPAPATPSQGSVIATTSAGPGVTAAQYAAQQLQQAFSPYASSSGSSSLPGGGGGYTPASPPFMTAGGGGGGGGGTKLCNPGFHVTPGGCCPNGMEWDAIRQGCVPPPPAAAPCAAGKQQYVSGRGGKICCDPPNDPWATEANQCCHQWNPMTKICMDNVAPPPPFEFNPNPVGPGPGEYTPTYTEPSQSTSFQNARASDAPSDFTATFNMSGLSAVADSKLLVLAAVAFAAWLFIKKAA
jgi:hypothetical protein